jgi:uncharacterized membrane protein YeaQ/YmgE (transglycosylase-associated protein family)
MFPPLLPGRRHGPGEEGPDRERRLEELSRGYEGSPWLTALVLFSGFLAAFVGSFAAILLLVNLPNGGELPFALILAALVGAHVSLRAVRYYRRRATGHRHPG